MANNQRIITDVDAAAFLKVTGFEVAVQRSEGRGVYVIPNTLETGAMLSLLRDGKIPGISAFLAVRRELLSDARAMDPTRNGAGNARPGQGSGQTRPVITEKAVAAAEPVVPPPAAPAGEGKPRKVKAERPTVVTGTVTETGTATGTSTGAVQMETSTVAAQEPVAAS